MTSPASGAPKKSLKTWQIVLIVFLVFLLIQQIIGKGKSESSTPAPVSTTNEMSWVPSGFFNWDSEIAYTFAENPTCNTYSVCTAIQVVANKDCPNSLYAELAIQDKNYVQYDYTNDSQGSLTKGTTAELTFNWPPDRKFAHFKVLKISCY